MTQEEKNHLTAKGLVALLPDDQREQCNRLIASIQAQLEEAGDVGTVALIYIGTKAQLKASQQ